MKKLNKPIENNPIRNKLIKSKLKSSKGLTLIEMLAALVMLILLILILNSGLNLAWKGYNDMTAESETELLMSTLSDAIYDELRYARDINTTAAPATDPTPAENPTPATDPTPAADPAADTPSGQADAPTPAASITGNLIKYTSVAFGSNTALSIRDGQLYAGTKRVLASGAYGNGDYFIGELNITYDNIESLFTVKLTVGGFNNIKATTEFVIRPLNSIG